MKWRCAWCGKPHDADDPPCEECGHSSFEKAVTRQVDLAPDAAAGSIQWVCEECGRRHPRHAPPCSRCGHTKLVASEAAYDDLPGDTASGYLELAGPREAVAAAVAVGLGAVLVLALAGVVSLPTLGPGQPTVSDVPGNATAAGDRSLPAVERALVAAVNDRREADGVPRLATDETLGAMAAFYNGRLVKARYADGEPPDPDEAFDGFEFDCERRAALLVVPRPFDGGDRSLASFDSAGAAAAALLDAAERRGGLPDGDRTEVGVDVHVGPDGAAYVTWLVC